MPQSARMQERFSRRLVLRRGAAILYILSGIAYLAWRLTIINDQALFLSGMYFLSDFIAVLLGTITIFVSWHYRHRRPQAVEPGLTADVFVPTYNEPVDMVRRTLRAAIAIRYPHQTWLLDDGDRPEMAALAQELGCHYLAREDNIAAKAGNLNHALAHSSGEFVAVFDADHIPQTHALDATLGFFADARVGMVQTPQDYFNVDALQYMNSKKGGLWHDQSFFYNLSQPGRDQFDAASCAGTSVIYRRSALEKIGGIPTQTVTEDVHTSLKLQKAGFLAPYLNEPIAYGVAAADLADYYRTRLRYGHGNLHALRHENILWCKGLTFRQRLSYMFLGLIYLEGWQQLMVFLVPAIALIFGIAPFQITILNVLIVMIYPLLSYLLMQEVGCGFSRYWTAEIFSMIRFPVHIVASAGLFLRKMRWRTSTKNIGGNFSLGLLAPQIFVLILSLTAVTVGFYRLEGRYTPGPLIVAVTDRIPVVQMAQAGYDATTQLVTNIQQQITDIVSPAPTDVPPNPIDVASQPVSPNSAPDDVDVPTTPPLDSAEDVEVSQPVTPEPTPEPTIIEEETPTPPIDWFAPLNRGYTIDLVLIAGFWAMVNAIRVILVILKVALNAKRAKKDYLFETIAPMRIETKNGPFYAIANKLSVSHAYLEGALNELRDEDFDAGLQATIYLPTGPVSATLRPQQSGWTPRRRTHTAIFVLECQSELDRVTLEDGLYATSWHRECLHNDAEFVTPMGAIGRLFGLGRSRHAKWSAALLQLSDQDQPDLALINKTGDFLLLADKEPANALASIITIEPKSRRNPKGWKARKVLLRSLISVEPFYCSRPSAKKMFKYHWEPATGTSDITVLRLDADARAHSSAEAVPTPAVSG